MFRLLVEKELKEIINSTKFAVTFGTCAVLILLTFYVGAKSYHVSRSQYEASVSENLRQIEKNTNWLMISHRIFLPPQPLAMLVTGISNDIGRNISMAGLGELKQEDSRFNDDPIYAIFRFLDLDFLFQVVLSLFAILFAYNAVNGEKELGTLRLTFANSVPRSKYILGKLTGSFLALGVPLLIPILIGCALLPVLKVPMTNNEWVRLWLIIFAGFIYFGFFLTLSVFTSILTHRSSTSFLILLVFWIFVVLIIPRVSVILAGRAVSVPSVDEIAAQKSKLSSQLFMEDREKMKSFQAKDNENMMQEFQSFMQDIADQRDKKMKEFGQKLDEDRRNKQAIQENLAFSIARISPAAVFSLAASDMAGTSLKLKKNYLDQANNYQKIYGNFQKEKTGGRTSGGAFMITIRNKDGEDREKTIDVKELPQFTFTQPSIAEVVHSSLFDICLLFIFNIVFFVGAFIAFLRYDLR